MKLLALWSLFIAAVIPLSACHWHHHHHRVAEGYYDMDHAQNDINRSETEGSSGVI
jgi:hypothetical protein